LSAATFLGDNLPTGVTVARVAPLHTPVDATGERFVAGVTARPDLKGARLLGLGLAARTRPQQAPRTCATSLGMTHPLTFVITCQI